jgi:peptidoglycan hydrolase FlgJ
MINIDHSVAIKSLNQPQQQNLDLKNHKKLKEQTDNFEALILKQMLDITMKDESSLFPKTTGNEIYQSMFNDELSRSLTGGFGYSKLLFEHLTKNN